MREVMPTVDQRIAAAAESNAKSFAKAAAELHTLNRNLEKLIRVLSPQKEASDGSHDVDLPADLGPVAPLQ